MADTLFTDATASVPGTPLVAAWHNAANTTVYNTLASVAGSNTITAVGPASMLAYLLGQRFFFSPVADNTGATTLNINGLGAIPVLFSGVALQSGMLVTGHVAEVYFDGTNFQLLNSQTFPLSSATGTLPFSQVTGIVPVVQGGSGVSTAAAAPWNPGRFLGIQRFTASGTYTPTAGTNKIIVHAYGAGGGGAGSGNPGAGQKTGGTPGSSGGWSVSLLTTNFSGKAVVIGAGGAGGVGANPGSPGGATTFDTTQVVANGGFGGSTGAGVAFSAQFVVGSPVGALLGTGNIITSRGVGASGLGGFVAPNQDCFGASGAPGFMGGNAAPNGVNANGSNAAANSGAGGNGTGANGAGPGYTGGTGGSGFLYIYEYA